MTKNKRIPRVFAVALAVVLMMMAVPAFAAISTAYGTMTPELVGARYGSLVVIDAATHCSGSAPTITVGLFAADYTTGATVLANSVAKNTNATTVRHSRSNIDYANRVTLYGSHQVIGSKTWVEYTAYKNV